MTFLTSLNLYIFIKGLFLDKKAPHVVINFLVKLITEGYFLNVFHFINYIYHNTNFFASLIEKLRKKEKTY